jgi:hypothetical protein
VILATPTLPLLVHPTSSQASQIGVGLRGSAILKNDNTDFIK